jgi:hypothetical protein
MDGMGRAGLGNCEVVREKGGDGVGPGGTEMRMRGGPGEEDVELDGEGGVERGCRGEWIVWIGSFLYSCGTRDLQARGKL